MAQLFADQPLPTRNKLDLDFLHKMGCKACPLAQVKNHHPDMEPAGAERPLVYLLGEGPTREDDEDNELFSSSSWRKLRAHIPRNLADSLRYNNVVRTRSPGNETPAPVAIECCRPSVEADIERSKPKAIFGFGEVPLKWVSGFTGVNYWRGRKMPVKIGTHSCWYYPMLHPAFLSYEGQRGSQEAERMFALDLKRAWAELPNLPPAVVHDTRDVFKNIQCLTDVDQIAEMLTWAAEEPDVGIDYETSALRPYNKSALLLSVAVDNGAEGFAFGFDHPGVEWTKAERAELDKRWRWFLINAEGRKWVHNLAFEMEWTAVRFGGDLLRKGRWEDTASQAVVLDERIGKQKPGCLSLEFLVQQHFGFNLKKLSGVSRSALAETPLPIVLRYNCADSRYHCLLGLAQEARIKAEGLEFPYELSCRKVPTVVLSQVKGVPVDQTEVQRLQVKYEDRLQALDDEIFDLPVVRDFNTRKREVFKPLSNPHVLYVMRDMLRRKECESVDKYTEKVKYSVDESVLERINHPLAELVVKYRKANKQLSTYVYPMLKGHEKSVVFDDGQIHTVFNTLFAETGRLSSEEPNLQNFPKRDGEAKEVRRSVAAPSGCSVLAVDYGQIEARVIAMFTHDKRFVKALWENYDVHYEWAERIAHAYPARVGGKKNLVDKKAMKLFRTDIKNQWTFPLFFGAKLESAAGYLQIPVDVLRPLYKEFWKQFSGVAEWQKSVLKFYEDHGYVECLTGRRRHGPLSPNQIINSPVQGTAAEIVLDGMARLSEMNDPMFQPEINIHDDLTYCCVPDDQLEDVAELVIGTMLKVPFEWAHIVPISVEASVGPNWEQLEEIGTFSSDKW